MTTWLEARKQEEHDQYMADIIKISQMVGSGKLSATNGRRLFSEFHDAHKLREYIFQKIGEVNGLA